MQHVHWIAEHHFGAHTTIIGHHSTPTSRHRRSSRWTWWLLLNNRMSFLSHHYLCVKFVLRLVRSIRVCIRVYKYTERSFYPLNAYKNSFSKINNTFLLYILGQWLLTKMKLNLRHLFHCIAVRLTWRLEKYGLNLTSRNQDSHACFYGISYIIKWLT